MRRTTAERRHFDVTKALRKRKISKEAYHFDYYDNLHQYSKNKIHCSCPLCRGKTNKKKASFKSSNINQNRKGINFSIRDLKRSEALDFSEEEYSNYL